MMLTKSAVIRTYFKSRGKDILPEDLNAFMHMCTAFDCLDSESYEEAKEKLITSVESIGEDIERAQDEFEEHEIIQRRLGPLGEQRGRE